MDVFCLCLTAFPCAELENGSNSRCALGVGGVGDVRVGWSNDMKMEWEHWNHTIERNELVMMILNDSELPTPQSKRGARKCSIFDHCCFIWCAERLGNSDLCRIWQRTGVHSLQPTLIQCGERKWSTSNVLRKNCEKKTVQANDSRQIHCESLALAIFVCGYSERRRCGRKSDNVSGECKTIYEPHTENAYQIV